MNFPGLKSRDNENVLGKFKNETPEKILIHKFCALKRDGYAKQTKVKEEKKLKGSIKRTPKNIRFEIHKHTVCVFK